MRVATGVSPQSCLVTVSFCRRFERGAITPQSFQLHKENLLRMVSYCENAHDCRCCLRHLHIACIAVIGRDVSCVCRRALQLSYFGETTFDRAQCKGEHHHDYIRHHCCRHHHSSPGTCDNCRAGVPHEQQDFTAYALALMELMEGVTRSAYVCCVLLVILLRLPIEP